MERRPIAIVTGADGGFGREFVRLLVREPGVEKLWCVARKADKLEVLRSELGRRSSPFPWT